MVIRMVNSRGKNSKIMKKEEEEGKQDLRGDLILGFNHEYVPNKAQLMYSNRDYRLNKGGT